MEHDYERGDQMAHGEPALSAPQNLDQASVLLGEIDALEMQIRQIKLNLTREIRELKAEAAEETANLRERLELKRRELQAFAAANRQVLVGQTKKKSVKVPTGTFGWRLQRIVPRVKDKMKAIKFLKGLKNWAKYIIVSEELNLTAIRQDREKLGNIPGIDFVGGHEAFFAKPNEHLIAPEGEPRKEPAMA